jgi:hypothetical protein
MGIQVRNMTKQKQTTEVQITVTYSPATDADERLRKAIELLLRPNPQNDGKAHSRKGNE